MTGAALARDEARITILGVPDRPGVVRTIFGAIASANIIVDMIVQNVATEGVTEVSFTVNDADLEQVLGVAREAAKAVGASGVTHDPDVAKVSVVGLGMRTHTGVAREMFDALAAAGINIQMITTSEIKISVLVARAAAAEALRLVHRAFELDRPIEELPPLPHSNWSATLASRRKPATLNGSSEQARPAPGGMEDLVISGVELDEGQACITLSDVPDRPGYAAQVFREIAEADVFVDMIVQNVSTAGNTLLSFTVPRHEADRAAKAAAKVGLGRVLVEPAIAKLSVLGVGMKTHTGVAARMFGALADGGVNIALINTSEVRINIATNHDRGQEALEYLRKSFDLPVE